MTEKTKTSENNVSGTEGVQRFVSALDLFSGAGGAGMGLSKAGFNVTGVDISPQPRYPFEFIQMDALDADLSGYDFVWASPPCQKHSKLATLNNKEYECFIERTRAKLMAWGGPYIIENVMGAPLLEPVKLCGSSFRLGVWRHRLFESNISLEGKPCEHRNTPKPVDVTGTGGFCPGRIRTDGGGGNSRKPVNIAQARQVMDIEWMTRKELSQAIPPAYSEYLGKQVLKAIAR